MIVLGASRQPGDRVLRNPPKRIRIWHSLAPDFIAPQWALQRTVTVKRIKCTRACAFSSVGTLPVCLRLPSSLSGVLVPACWQIVVSAPETRCLGTMAFQFDLFSFTQWIAMITGIACMWSACIVALCFFAFPELRSAWRLYVLFLSLANFLQGLYYTLDGAGIFHDRSHEGTLGCKVFAFMGIWSASSSFIWSACVSAYVTFFLTQHMRRAPRQSRATPLVTMLFCLLSFGYPTVVLVLLIEDDKVPNDLVPLNYNLLSEDAHGGFVDRDEFGWRLVSIYGPLWLSMFVVTACSLVSLMQLRAHVNASDETKQQRNLRQLRRRMLAIPLIFVLCRLPETIYRCVEWSVGPKASDLSLRRSALSTALKGLLAFTQGAQGIATALIFVWTSPAYRRRLYQLWLRACGCSHDGAHDGASPAASSSISSSIARAPLLISGPEAAAGAALPPVIVISPSTARRALGASFAAAALLGSPRRRATANEGDTESADTEEYFPLAAELAAEEALEMALEEALAASPPGGVHGRGGVSLSS